jgi:holo-[acyl-carrier protein] synthase
MCDEIYCDDSYSNLASFGVGTDIEAIERFNNYTLSDDSNFLRSIFSESELEYCFSKESPANHLAVRFVGKESVIKALYSIGIENVFYRDIEILNKSNGVPYIKLDDMYKNIQFQISLSHSKENAIAFVIAMEVTDNE